MQVRQEVGTARRPSPLNSWFSLVNSRRCSPPRGPNQELKEPVHPRGMGVCGSKAKAPGVEEPAAAAKPDPTPEAKPEEVANSAQEAPRAAAPPRLPTVPKEQSQRPC